MTAATLAKVAMSTMVSVVDRRASRSAKLFVRSAPSGHAAVTYGTAPINVTITGSTNPRCSGAGAPNTCVYRWTEVYYNSANTRFARVCSIDNGCLWQTAHTSWTQLSGKDYWVKSIGQLLPDGDLADAYLCVGSSPASWTSYTSSHNFDTLMSQPTTSAQPLPSGTC